MAFRERRRVVPPTPRHRGLFAFAFDNKQPVRVRSQDWREMALHHVVTPSLLWFSCWLNWVRVGSLVLVSHDAADVFLELLKMSAYLELRVGRAVAYVVFVCVWVLTRLIYYPVCVIFPYIYKLVGCRRRALPGLLASELTARRAARPARLLVLAYRPGRAQPLPQGPSAPLPTSHCPLHLLPLRTHTDTRCILLGISTWPTGPAPLSHISTALSTACCYFSNATTTCDFLLPRCARICKRINTLQLFSILYSPSQPGASLQPTYNS